MTHTGSKILEENLRMERSLERLGQTPCDLPLQAGVFLGLSLEKASQCCGLFYVLCLVLSSGSGVRGRKKRSHSLPLQLDHPIVKVVSLKTFLVLSVLYLKTSVGISLFKNSDSHPHLWATPFF